MSISSHSLSTREELLKTEGGPEGGGLKPTSPSKRGHRATAKGAGNRVCPNGTRAARPPATDCSTLDAHCTVCQADCNIPPAPRSRGACKKGSELFFRCLVRPTTNCPAPLPRQTINGERRTRRISRNRPAFIQGSAVSKFRTWNVIIGLLHHAEPCVSSCISPKPHFSHKSPRNCFAV